MLNFIFYFLVFYWGITLGFLWSLRSLVTGWTKRTKFFSLKNPHTRFAKKISSPILRFLPNFEVKLVLRKQLKTTSCYSVANFLEISNPLSEVRLDDAEDFYSLAWKMYLNFSILQLWRAYQSRCDQVYVCFKKLLLRSTNWYMNHADCMH